jgi:hypothetical protein
MTQAQQADIVKVSLLTLSRRRREEHPIDDPAQMLIRIMVIGTPGLDVKFNIGQESADVSYRPRSEPIRINAANPAHTRLLAASFNCQALHPPLPKRARSGTPFRFGHQPANPDEGAIRPGTERVQSRSP